ncbi:MAG: PIN domain nuclease [Actinobacteria bacterium]|nr:PIN domain nuclease [Actinomycetota bacterium]
MALNGWLIDKSALVRLPHSPQAKLWAQRISAGEVHLSTITRLEIGYSARSEKELLDAFTTPPLSAMPIEGLTPKIEELAWDTLKQLAKRGQHRAPSIPDLLIAATAQLCDLYVLHFDKDFDIISKITGQQVEKLRVKTP